jgi:hypothetical protein
MTVWGLSVVASAAGEVRAMALLQPADETAHGEVARRLKAAGLAAVRPPDWHRFALTRTQCSITVEHGHVTQAHTGRSRMLCQPPAEVSERWMEAAAGKLVIFGLLTPGSLPNVEGMMPPELAEHGAELVAELVDQRRVLAGFATVLDAPAPAPGSGTRTTWLG